MLRSTPGTPAPAAPSRSCPHASSAVADCTISRVHTRWYPPRSSSPFAMPHGIEADAINAPENVLSSCVRITLWLIRDSRPPSVDAAARSVGVRARIHCSTNRSQCFSYGIASACIISLKRRVVPIAQPDRNRELPVPRHIDLAHDRNIPIQRLAERPRHLHVRHQVLVAVALPHIPARRPRKPAVRPHRQRHRPMPRQQHPLARHQHDRAEFPAPPPCRCGASSA